MGGFKNVEKLWFLLVQRKVTKALIVYERFKKFETLPWDLAHVILLLSTSFLKSMFVVALHVYMAF